MTEWALDASAVLALLRGEPGAGRVAEALPNAVLSSVNAAEVVTRLMRLGAIPGDATAAVTGLDCPIADVDAELGLRAGTLSLLTASRGLSLGDRVCLALAEREDRTALTTDRAWTELGLPIKIELLR